MAGYHKLTENEIKQLSAELQEPKDSYPHYNPIQIDKTKEIFKNVNIYRLDGIKVLSVSNYGRVKYNNLIVEPYIVGTFLHCTKVYSPDFGDHYVYNLVKEAFDPIPNRSNFQIHHINNNALDNRPENLIYVTEEEHRKIDFEFNKKLLKISHKIYEKNLNDLINFFNLNSERSFNGSELLYEFNTVYRKVVMDNVKSLCERRILICFEKGESFEYYKYGLNESYI
ncbi:HNH endonuclease [Treponema bryantii]|uniref:HNH endonuclease n=1 Tax=Treponema bryantii TaxID=163 RepID=UPI002B2D3058|nr:hypothetical protein TRBR_14740 [Treponema bryantii]